MCLVHSGKAKRSIFIPQLAPILPDSRASSSCLRNRSVRAIHELRDFGCCFLDASRNESRAGREIMPEAMRRRINAVGHTLGFPSL